MINDIFKLASHFSQTLKESEHSEESLIKSAGKEKVNRNRLSKKLDKAKSDYSRLKSDLDVLEANDAKLKQHLETTRSGAQAARKAIMQMHDAQRKMDLADANDAVFYADDDDVGYLVGGKEVHISVDDNGEVSMTPMSQHRKSKKLSKKDVKKDETCADENCSDDSHDHYAPGSKEVESEEPDETAEFDDLYASLVEE
jgi:predicted nuclease with TOPRIM domain